MKSFNPKSVIDENYLSLFLYELIQNIYDRVCYYRRKYIEDSNNMKRNHNFQ
jgi:hypothetical protein